MKQEPVTHIMAEALKDINHWCDRTRHPEEDSQAKIVEHQPYWAGDNTQK